jgi:hypothetical protein
VSKQHIVEVVSEEVPSKDVVPLGAMKKNVAAKAGERAIASSNWLAELL